MQDDALLGKGLVGCVDGVASGCAAVTLDGVGVPGRGGEWRQWALPLGSEQLQRWPTSAAQSPLAAAGSPPLLFEGSFTIGAGEVADCWIDMAGWSKGNVFVNGVMLGRFWSRGPRTSLFVAAPLLRQGRNVLRVLELEPRQGPAKVQLRDTP